MSKRQIRELIGVCAWMILNGATESESSRADDNSQQYSINKPPRDGVCSPFIHRQWER